MHVEGPLNGELVEAERGGHATIFQTKHNNRQVAVKTIRITMNRDFDKCHSVRTSVSMRLEIFLTMGTVGNLSGGCRVGTSPAPKHSTVARCGFGRTSAFDDIWVDG